MNMFSVTKNTLVKTALGLAFAALAVTACQQDDKEIIKSSNADKLSDVTIQDLVVKWNTKASSGTEADKVIAAYEVLTPAELDAFNKADVAYQEANMGLTKEGGDMLLSALIDANKMAHRQHNIGFNKLKNEQIDGILTELFHSNKYSSLPQVTGVRSKYAPNAKVSADYNICNAIITNYADGFCASNNDWNVPTSFPFSGAFSNNLELVSCCTETIDAHIIGQSDCDYGMYFPGGVGQFNKISANQPKARFCLSKFGKLGANNTYSGAGQLVIIGRGKTALIGGGITNMGANSFIHY